MDSESHGDGPVSWMVLDKPDSSVALSLRCCQAAARVQAEETRTGSCRNMNCTQSRPLAGTGRTEAPFPEAETLLRANIHLHTDSY